jgi:hypothetical protein
MASAALAALSQHARTGGSSGRIEVPSSLHSQKRLHRRSGLIDGRWK